MKKHSGLGKAHVILFAAGLCITAIASTGCQVSVGGQTLPSPYYASDDVQFFPPGQEFLLSRAANRMKAFNAQRQLPDALAPAPPVP